ncbi:hypothetical protein D3C76_1104250 [compost metagenome]
MKLAQRTDPLLAGGSIQEDGSRTAGMEALRPIRFIRDPVSEAQILEQAFERTFEIEEIDLLGRRVPAFLRPIARQQQS